MSEHVLDDDSATTEFAISKRGYDKDEVDAHIARLTSELQLLNQQRDEADERARNSHQAVGNQLGEMLQHSRDWADRMVADAERDAARIREEARSDAQRTADDAARKADETRTDAQAKAELTRAEAERRAEHTRAEAQRDADQQIARAEARVEEAREAEGIVRQRVRALRERLELIVEQLEEEDTDETTSGGDGGTDEVIVDNELEPNAPYMEEDTGGLAPAASDSTGGRE